MLCVLSIMQTAKEDGASGNLSCDAILVRVRGALSGGVHV